MDFGVHPDLIRCDKKNSIAAIIAGGRLVDLTVALAGAGVDLTRVDVLQGEIGAEYWTSTAPSTGFGRTSNERENFANALHDGDLIVPFPFTMVPM